MMTLAHVPVLLDRCVAYLEPGSGRRIVDGTFGYGGHATALLERGAEVLGLDLDARAVAACRQTQADMPRLQCRQGSFQDLPAHLRDVGWSVADGILLDLGVNSRQLDDPSQGFTYREDAPLDMRFDVGQGRPASALLQDMTEVDLAQVLWNFGEERASRRLARAVVVARQEEPILTTGRLRSVIQGALPRSARVPATLSRVFQALRIAVNDELGALRTVLLQIPRCLAPGGRVVIIAYHSLEDRLVKQSLDRESRDCICPPEAPACACGHRRTLEVLTRKAVRPTSQEIQENPRARSARLRAAKIVAPGGRRR